MDFTHRIMTNRENNHEHEQHQAQTYGTETSSEEGVFHRPQKNRRTAQNTPDQLSNYMLEQQDVLLTINHQLLVADHNKQRHLEPNILSSSRRFHISNSAHEFSPAVTFFAVSGSHPNNLYRIISFDKLHVLDLGIIRQYCDLTNSIIQRNYNLPLSRLPSILNDRYIDLPTLAHLPYNHPFRSSKEDGQAGSSG